MRVFSIVFAAMSVFLASNHCLADFQFFFDSPTFNTTVGGTTNVSLIARETGTTNFSSNLLTASFTVSVAPGAQFTGVSWNPNLNTGTSFGGPTSAFTFSRSSFFNPGVAASPVAGGLQATLGTFTVQSLVAGDSTLSVNYHGGAGVNEMVFGPSAVPVSIDLNGALPPVHSFTSSTITAVPEPSSIALLGAVAIGGVAFRRFRRKAVVA